MQMEVDFAGGLKVYSTYKGFTVKTDQPIDEGGANTAPEPFDLFLSSLGTCAGVYILYFCKERGLNSEGIRLILDFERDETAHRVTKITMNIILPDDFPKKYHSTIERVAGMCTVKKHLAQPPEFDIKASFLTDV
jgi:ribosomal protein S12 methylthiotransferase accessory factor